MVLVCIKYSEANIGKTDEFSLCCYLYFFFLHGIKLSRRRLFAVRLAY